MKCIIFIISALLSLSTCVPINHDNLPMSTTAVTLESNNRSSRRTFSKKHSLKFLVNQRFNITEIAEVADNEPELQYILTLSPFANDTFRLIQALSEDVFNEKKPYDTLYPLLALYIKRIYKTLSSKQQLIYFESKFNNSIYYNLVAYYMKRGNYRSAFEALKDSPWMFFSKCSELFNKEFFKMIKENHHYTKIIEDSFNQDNTLKGNVDRWVSNCILYDCPESFYVNYFSFQGYNIIHVLKDLVTLRTSVPLKEYHRIHAILKKWVNEFSELAKNDLYFYNLVIDICFDHEKSEIIDYTKLTNNQISYIATISAFGRKSDIFRQIYNNQLLWKCSKQMIFKILFNYNNYYAIKNIKIVNNQLIIDIIAPGSSLALGLPPILKFEFEANTKSIDNLLYASGYKNSIWSAMRVINEEIFYSFLCDFERLSLSKKYKMIETNVEVIKLVVSSSKIFEKIKSTGIRLIPKDFDCLLEFLNFIKNTNGLFEIFNFDLFLSRYEITKLRTKKQLKKFEEISGKTVSNIFINQDDGNLSENDYFSWRLILDYWIKSDQKYKIVDIKSPNIIKLLKLEFNNEMNKTLNY